MPAVENEYPRKQALSRFGLTAALLVSVVVAAHFSQARPGLLIDQEGLSNAANIFSSLFHPNLSSEFLERIVFLSFESLFMGLLGTLLGVLLGVGLAVIGARLPNLPDPPGRTNPVTQLLVNVAQTAARLLLIFFRAIPDVIWAYLFVMFLGLGPGPAVFAIALATSGIVGKLFAELAEAVDARLVHCIRATGTGHWGTWWHCVLPQVKRQWIAYALFRMECNIRSGSILGVVGAGGLGSEIALSIRYFEYDKLATALIAILVFVIVLEFVSAILRQKPLRWSLLFAVVGGAVSIAYLNIPWPEMFSFPLGAAFGGDRFSTSWNLLSTAFSLSLETLFIAWCATLVAALFAFVLAPVATRHLVTGSYVVNVHPKRGLEKARAWFALSAARFLMQLFRAMPELTFALIFVVWVGPGPFAGVLAIAAHTFGVLGRLYTDVYEEVEHPPPAALQSAGVGALGVWLFAVLPQVFPRLMAFTLYRFEVNVRVTATVGFVGAGGIGDAIHSAISLFHFADLAVLIGVMLAVVIVVDYLGSKARLRILRRGHTQGIKETACAGKIINPAPGIEPARSTGFAASIQFKAKDRVVSLPASVHGVTPRGVVLVCDQTIPVGTEVKLEARSSDQEIPSSIRGRVVEYETLDGKRDGRLALINIDYDKIDSGFQKALEKILDRCAENQATQDVTQLRFVN
jgi:phosphonate transport system permease protein